MTKNVKPSLIFFGSGPVAAASLSLLKDTFDFEAVVTKSTTEHELKTVSGGIPVYCVSDKNELDALFTTVNFTSNLAILIDFGIIVSNKIIDHFERGIINSHFSLLPELRGADPISFAILEGKKSTGVSLMLLVEAMDEGPILSQVQLSLDGNETTPSLTDGLVKLSAEQLEEAVPRWINGEIKTIAQDAIITPTPVVPSYTRKLMKSDGLIDWNKPALQLEREVRAYAGWPKSTTRFSTIDCVITGVTVLKTEGEVNKLFIQDKKLGVYCGKQALLIDTLKPAGKNEMDSTAFLAGYRTRLGL